MSSAAAIALLVCVAVGAWLLALAGLVIFRRVGLAIAAAIADVDWGPGWPDAVRPRAQLDGVDVGGGLEELALELLAQASIRGRRP